MNGWDYAHPGRYFVTIVVKDRECLFGRVINGAMEYSPLGLIADAFWRQIPAHHASVSLDEYIVMPNHVHGIVIINEKQPTDVNVHDGGLRGRDGSGREIHSRDVDGKDVHCGDVHGRDVHRRDVQLNVPAGETNVLNVPTDNTNATNVPKDDANPMYHPGTGEKKRMSPAKGSLSVIIRTFKAAVTTWAHGNGYGGFAWLGRFHDHIIRSDDELDRIRAYIRNNPLNWALDHENPPTPPSHAS